MEIYLKFQLEFAVLVFNDNENWYINRITEAIYLFAVFDVLYWRCNHPMKFKHYAALRSSQWQKTDNEKCRISIIPSQNW